MQDIKIREQKDVLRHIAKASDAIRRKHRMIKSGREIAEKAMSNVFKPVVAPLQQLVNLSQTAGNPVKEEIEPIKDEIKQPREEEENDSFSTVDEDEEEDEANSTIVPSTIEKSDEVVNEYLQMLENKNKKSILDNVCGVRKLAHNRLFIGDSPIRFENDSIRVGDTRYTETKGLLELLFKKIPNETYVTSNDIENYKKIVFATNAHRLFYKNDKPIRNSNDPKFMKLFAISPPKPKRTGKGILPRYMIAQEGTGTDYVHWDDPNELVDRLRLLLASQAAGNPSHSNEITSIIEELCEAGITY
jgi:hypothetical protein